MWGEKKIHVIAFKRGLTDQDQHVQCLQKIESFARISSTTAEKKAENCDLKNMRTVEEKRFKNVLRSCEKKFLLAHLPETEGGQNVLHNFQSATISFL